MEDIRKVKVGMSLADKQQQANEITERVISQLPDHSPYIKWHEEYSLSVTTRGFEDWNNNSKVERTLISPLYEEGEALINNACNGNYCNVVYKVSGLKPNTRYSFRIESKNLLGRNVIVRYSTTTNNIDDMTQRGELKPKGIWEIVNTEFTTNSDGVFYWGMYLNPTKDVLQSSVFVRRYGVIDINKSLDDIDIDNYLVHKSDVSSIMGFYTSNPKDYVLLFRENLVESKGDKDFAISGYATCRKVNSKILSVEFFGKCSSVGTVNSYDYSFIPTTMIEEEYAKKGIKIKLKSDSPLTAECSQITFYEPNGNIDVLKTGFGGHFAYEPSAQGHNFGRYYTAQGNFGGWSSHVFALNTMFKGVMYYEII